MNYKTSAQTGVDKTIQLASHATLGCASGAAAGGDCASGAVAGVVGELAAETYADYALKQELANDGFITRADLNKIKQQGVQVASLAGSASAIFTGNLTGLDDSEVAQNMHIGGRVGRNAGENNAISGWIQEVAFDQYHASVKIEPENQEKYSNDDRFIRNPETGKLYATIGGGPDTKSNIFGSLVGDQNRSRDLDPSIKIYETENFVDPKLEDWYIEKLFQANQNYKNNLEYSLFPSSSNNKDYNSNSYYLGILKSVGIHPPSLPTKTINYQYEGWEYNDLEKIEIQYNIPKFSMPGYNKPVPNQYFE